MHRTSTYHYYSLLLLLLVTMVPVCMAWGSYRHAQQKQVPRHTKFVIGPAVAAAPAPVAVDFPSVLLLN